ncbi:hypothetical protein O0I10_008044 [Lichtheimia ornata]|uniref:Major facilitator superfamily (MFS) profile domain-containing protein n=1 Tax=Lichtheimia ornata TaxID=688661 RepID=A0AAD7V0Z0_9FUNG|nr:uncharacterized protein O0I10_008044 [Lichtheimia ornata]KAJ8656250.1 hypothetical protein O0I10_008044 [Lichtheimia ornata]
MIASSSQALSDSTTSHQPIVPQSSDTSSSSDIISSNSSADSSDHKISHKHDHRHSVQENVVEHRPEETSLTPSGNDNGITKPDDDTPAYYTEGLKNPGWLTVFATFMLNFYTIGVVSSWNVFQVLYLEVYAEQTDEARVALIGTSMNAIMYALGLVATPIIQRLHYRGTIFLGAVICCPLSQIFASFATEIWQVALLQGVMFGFGTGLCYTASSTLPSQWFFRNRGLASGLASMGGCIGPMVFSPMTQALITSLGYRNALRVLAAIGFTISCLGVILIRPRYPSPSPPSPPPSSSSSLSSVKSDTQQSKWWQRFLALDRAMFTWKYNFYLLHSFLVSFAYTTPVILSQTYATELGADPAFASIFVSILEACNGLSRLIFGWLADHCIGRINVVFLTTLISGIFTSVIWQNAMSIHIYLLYCVLFGLTGGVFNGFQPVVIAEIVGVKGIQEGVGVVYFMALFGYLAGTPIAGALHIHYGWTAAIQFTGAMTMASAMAVLGTRLLFNKRLLAKV